MSFIIGKKCIGVKDGTCVRACPIKDCIQDGGEMMFINPKTCINCASCIFVCPVDAIYMNEEQAIEAGELEAVENNYKHFGYTF